jgi:NitT/TauT family transport system ATP-binding protein
MKGLPLRSDVQAQSAPTRGQTAAMIEIDAVSQVFQTSGRQSHLALSNISLAIDDGAFVSMGRPAVENRRCSISSAASLRRARVLPG